jgi:hypothetical protein
MPRGSWRATARSPHTRWGDHDQVTKQQDLDVQTAIRVADAAAPAIRVAAEMAGTSCRMNSPFAEYELNGAQHSVHGFEAASSALDQAIDEFQEAWLTNGRQEGALYSTRSRHP